MLPAYPCKVADTIGAGDSFSATFLYYYLLERPDLVIPMLAHGGPWYGAFLLKKMFPRLKKTMKQSMKIDQAGYEKSKEILLQASAKLQAQLQDKEFLVGNEFSRADLVMASLWAPLARVDGYGFNWPEATQLPAELVAMEKEFTPVLSWVKKIYEAYR